MHDFVPSEHALSHNKPYRFKHTSDDDDSVIRYYLNASKNPSCIDLRRYQITDRFQCQNSTSNNTSSFHFIPIDENCFDTNRLLDDSDRFYFFFRMIGLNKENKKSLKIPKGVCRVRKWKDRRQTIMFPGFLGVFFCGAYI